VGANGAGKSSVLLAAFGSIRHEGTVRLGNGDVTKMSASRRLRSGIAMVPQGRQLFPRLTVRENLQVAAEQLRLPRSAVIEAEERFPILATRHRRRAGVLSGGEQQMLAVARALMGRPRVLLLDEIATGLAPLIVQELIATARALASEGIAVLLAAPELAALRSVVDRGYVMVRGTVVAQTENGGPALERLHEKAMSGTHASLA
jgi:branched-chain amino acid transport system ATP-binding protein